MQKFNSEKPFYTRNEVATMLNVSLVTLYKWNLNGTLKAKGIGRRVLYSFSDIQNAIVEL